jgi:chromosome segregation protein
LQATRRSVAAHQRPGSSSIAAEKAVQAEVEANLNRPRTINEIRRQSGKPLGRQKSRTGQPSSGRDAKARLLADDLLQATQALQSELADEQAMNERRRALELALDAARAAEVAAEEAVREGVPRLSAAQETWYSLAALRERVATTLSIARERMRRPRTTLVNSWSG